MAKFQITGPDGAKYEVTAPDNASEQDVLAYFQGQMKSTPKVPERTLMQGVGRQLGLTARYGMEGAPAIVDMVSAPFRLGAEALTGRRIPALAETTGNLADTLGLPKPETPQERIVGEGAKMMAGAAPMVKGAQMAGNVVQGGAREVMTQLAARPGAQVASSAASGVAGQAAKEDGSGAGGQVAASFLAALATPMAMQGATNAATSVRGAIKGRFNPQQFDAVLKSELVKAGIDWDTLGGQAREALRKDVQNVLYQGQPLDAAGLRRLAEFRRIGATPLLGDVTMNPRDVTLQRNLSKQIANQSGISNDTADLPNIANANARTVLNTLTGAADSPMDAYATGERLIRGVQNQDDAISAGVKGLYGEARDAAGRDLPLDRGAFVGEAFDNLIRENKVAFLPDNIKTLLNQISTGKVNVNGREMDTPFDVNTIDQLKTILANASQSGDGNTRAAVKAVRMALDNVSPNISNKTQFGGNQAVTGQMGQAMQAADDLPAIALQKFDEARKAAKGQFQWREGAKFIEDALGGATPDNFVKKHVINAPAEELAKVRGFVSKDKELTEAIKKQLVDYIVERGKGDADIGAFNSAGMRDALKAVGDRKLAMFFTGKEIADLKAAVGVARSMQAQPIGSAVNNSNTGAMLTGRLADWISKASGVPVLGPMVANPMRGFMLDLQARDIRNVGQGLLPQGQGVTVGGNAFPVPMGLLGGLPAVPPREDDRR